MNLRTLPPNFLSFFSMNLSMNHAGNRAKMKSDGSSTKSKAYKKSRLENLRGGGKNEAIPQAMEEAASTKLSSPLSQQNDSPSAHGTLSQHKMSRKAFEDEIPVEEEEESQDEADSMDVVIVPTVTLAPAPAAPVEVSLSPQLVAPTALLDPAIYVDPAPTGGPAAQYLPPATAGPSSRQKPFSASGKASQRNTISSVWGGIKEFTSNLLKQVGRTAEKEKDIGHILQHAGGRIINEATSSRGNIEALEMLNLFQAKHVENFNNDVAELAAQAPAGPAARRWERFTLAKSELVQNVVKSYTEAAQGTAGKDTRARVLSHLAESFSLKELNNWVFGMFGGGNVKISKHQFKTARLNALGCGTGNIPVASKIVRRKIGTDELRVPDVTNDAHSAYVFCTEFVQSYLTPLAFGTRQTSLSTGEILELNRIERTRSREEIRRLYLDACEHGYDVGADGARVQIPCVPREHFNVIIDTLSGGAENASLAALDSVYCKFGLQNFDLFRRFIKIISAGRPQLENDLNAKCARVELFLRKEYADHVFGESRAAPHSKRHAFGDGTDDVDGTDGEANEGDTDPLFCVSCQSISHFLLDLEEALTGAILHPLEDTREELGEYLGETLVKNLDIYLGHLVRKVHETDMEQKIFSDLDKSTQCVITMDYKMKVLSMVWRESMSHFFGKRGISFLGFAITRSKTEAEKAAEGVYDQAHPRVASFRSEFVTEFYDAISDDATEDGWALGRAVVPIVSEYHARNPHITAAIVLTDGAGNFAGTEFWIFLSLLHLFTGIKVILHIVKEAGCGKSFLDTHFAFCMHILTLLVAEGRGTMDITCASDIVRNLTTNAGVAKPTCHARDEMKQRQLSAKAVRRETALQGQIAHVNQQSSLLLSRELQLPQQHSEWLASPRVKQQSRCPQSDHGSYVSVFYDCTESIHRHGHGHVEDVLSIAYLCHQANGKQSKSPFPVTTRAPADIRRI